MGNKPSTTTGSIPPTRTSTSRASPAPPANWYSTVPVTTGLVRVSAVPTATPPPEGPTGLGCLICHEPFSGDARCVVLQCGHIFDINCLLSWIDQSLTCPTCRMPVTVGSTRNGIFSSVPLDTSPPGSSSSSGESSELRSRLEAAEVNVALKTSELTALNGQFQELFCQKLDLQKEIEDLKTANKALTGTIKGHENTIRQKTENYNKKFAKMTQDAQNKQRIIDMQKATIETMMFPGKENQMLPLPPPPHFPFNGMPLGPFSVPPPLIPGPSHALLQPPPSSGPAGQPRRQFREFQPPNRQNEETNIEQNPPPKDNNQSQNQNRGRGRNRGGRGRGNRGRGKGQQNQNPEIL